MFQLVSISSIILHHHLANNAFSLSIIFPNCQRSCLGLVEVSLKSETLSTDIFRCIYNALFKSFLQYGIVIWGQTFSFYIEPLFKLQKTAIRTLSHQTALSHSLPLFKGLQLLRVSDVFKLKLLTFVYDSMTMLAPSFLHNHATRQSCHNNLYLICKHTLRYGLGTIRYLGAKLWNELPREIRTSSSRSIISRNYKNTY